MSWESKQLQILLATARSLNAERKCAYPPVPDTFYFLEIDPSDEFVSIGEFENDWTIRFCKESRDYIVEAIASRKDEFPEEFGQDSYIAVDAMVFQITEIVTSQTQNEINQPFVTAGLRPTIKFHCNLTREVFEI